ncbi:MAG: hypothetical protein RJA10_1809 [Pseudomonadota bacterium]|jgi:hypothetical protein
MRAGARRRPVQPAAGPMAGLFAAGLMLLLPAAVDAQGPDAAASPAATICGADLPVRARRQAASPRHQVAFALRPAPAVGRHFGIDLVVCPQAGAAMPQALRVDADMPAHRHGMNYRPTVQALGGGRYRVEGLLFHMAGAWRLMFELSADGRIDRLTHDLALE